MIKIAVIGDDSTLLNLTTAVAYVSKADKKLAAFGLLFFLSPPSLSSFIPFHSLKNADFRYYFVPVGKSLFADWMGRQDPWYGRYIGCLMESFTTIFPSIFHNSVPPTIPFIPSPSPGSPVTSKAKKTSDMQISSPTNIQNHTNNALLHAEMQKKIVLKSLGSPDSYSRVNNPIQPTASKPTPVAEQPNSFSRGYADNNVSTPRPSPGTPMPIRRPMPHPRIAPITQRSAPQLPLPTRRPLPKTPDTSPVFRNQNGQPRPPPPSRTNGRGGPGLAQRPNNQLNKSEPLKSRSGTLQRTDTPRPFGQPPVKANRGGSQIQNIQRRPTGAPPVHVPSPTQPVTPKFGKSNTPQITQQHIQPQIAVRKQQAQQFPTLQTQVAYQQYIPPPQTTENSGRNRSSVGMGGEHLLPIYTLRSELDNFLREAKNNFTLNIYQCECWLNDTIQSDIILPFIQYAEMGLSVETKALLVISSFFSIFLLFLFIYFLFYLYQDPVR